MKRKWTCCAAALLVAAVVHNVAAQQTILTWDGEAGGPGWWVPANWSPDAYPETSYRLIVAGDTPVAGGTVRADDGGSITFDGPTTSAVISSLIIGLGGDGTMDVFNGAQILSDGTNSFIGNDAGARGVITVRGLSSLWANDGGLYVGYYGNGTLEISDGGAVSNAAGFVGQYADSLGSVTVNGAGSAWTNNGLLYVGRYGSGTLTISNGGAVSNISGYVGRYADSAGDVTVSGAGSTWTNNGLLYVGLLGSGALTIDQGATVSVAGFLRLADSSGSFGTVNLRDGFLTAGSLSAGAGTADFNWTSGTLAITGTGGLTLNAGELLGSVVTISSGKVLRVDAGTTVNSGVQLEVGGGTFLTDTLSIGYGGQASLRSGIIDIADTFAVASGGLLELMGQNLALASTPTIQGDLTLDHTTLSVPASLTVSSASGTASVNMDNGAWLFNVNGYLGYTSGGSGDASVSGAGSHWANSNHLYVGFNGSGSLAITDGGAVSNNGGYVGAAPAASGDVTVEGAGSTWISRSGLFVGYSGTGSLTIDNSAAVVNSTGNVGFGGTSMGSVSVTGAGSTWTNQGYLYVGREGTGTLTIDEGGAVSVADELRIAFSAGSSGTVNLQGGSLSARSIAAGNGMADFNWTGGTLALTGPAGLTLDSGGLMGSTVTVSSGKGLQVAAETAVGAGILFDVGGGTFSTNTLSVASGGRAMLRAGAISIADTFAVAPGGELLIAGQNLALATEPTIEGDLTVDRTTLSVPSVSVGSGSGTARLTITGGGSVSSYLSGSAGNSFVGDTPAGAGEVTVSGAGSTWTIGNHLVVGWEGDGTLTIADGGSVSNSDGFVGYQPGVSGNVTVRGARSTWTNNGLLLYVGMYGTGTLTISDGGTVSNNISYVGVGLGGDGHVTVSGPGSTWANGSDLDVGREGTGTLSVTGGGSVSNTVGRVGNWAGSSGEVTVSGAGSTWTNGGALELGREGTGTLLIAGGGAVRVGDSLWVGVTATGAGTLTIAGGGTVDVADWLIIGNDLDSESTVNLQGGSLIARRVGGFGNFNWTGGSLAITGPDGLTLDGGLLGPVVNVTADKGLSVSGATTVAAGVKLAVAGGSFSTETLDVFGTAQLHGGSVAIGDTFTVNEDGVLEIVGQDLVVLNVPNVDGALILDRTALSAPSLTVPLGASLDLDSGRISLDGAFTNQEVVRMGAAGAATIRAGSLANTGVLLGRGSIQALAANTGTIALSGDSSFSEDLVNQLGGWIVISGGASVTFFEDVDNQVGAEIRVSEASSATYFGNLTGNGKFTGTGTSYFYGDMRPGASPGTMAFEGDVVFRATAGLEIELGGLAPSQYDAVNVDGHLSLDGRVTVSEVDMFEALPGDQFTVLTYGTRDGEFSQVDTPSMPAGLWADLLFDDAVGEGVLQFDGLAGDANLDGYVNEMDLDILATNWETAVTRGWKLGEFNNDGSIDIGDLTAMAGNWQTDIFGNGSPEPFHIALFEAALARAAVPEPSTLALLACSAVVLPVLGWRRHRQRALIEGR